MTSSICIDMEGLTLIGQRGNPNKSDTEKDKKKKKSPNILTVKRSTKENDEYWEHSYSDMACRVRLDVDQAVVLEALGFYGPARTKKSFYTVHLNFCFMDEKQINEVSVHRQVTRHLFRQEEINRVPLTEPLYVPKFRKLVIVFMLGDGAATSRAKSLKSEIIANPEEEITDNENEDEQENPCDKGKGESVKKKVIKRRKIMEREYTFSFFSSSHQIPELYFLEIPP